MLFLSKLSFLFGKRTLRMTEGRQAGHPKELGYNAIA
jgi:hypothetical protein